MSQNEVSNPNCPFRADEFDLKIVEFKIYFFQPVLSVPNGHIQKENIFRSKYRFRIKKYIYEI